MSVFVRKMQALSLMATCESLFNDANFWKILYSVHNSRDIMRKKTKEVSIGKVRIGNNNPIAIQSMTNTPTKDASRTIKQIHALEEAGCEIVRISVPDEDCVKALPEIRKNTSIPLVADIHFDYKLAIAAAKYVDKLRLNPGNIGNEEKIKAVVKEAKDRNLPIRIGVNIGSLERDIEAKLGLTAEALVASASRHIALLEKQDFYNIVVSLKASDVPRTIEAYRQFSEKYDYPTHVGVTEAGTLLTGSIKSALGIGTLLQEGIGDTIRVSLSADPVQEIKVAKEILNSLRLRRFGVEVTSCPTCSRTHFDVMKIAEEIEEKTAKLKMPKHVSVMGCCVNGPGEAKEADVGIVGYENYALLYKKGKLVGKIGKEGITDEILQNLK